MERKNFEDQHLQVNVSLEIDVATKEVLAVRPAKNSTMKCFNLKSIIFHDRKSSTYPEYEVPADYEEIRDNQIDFEMYCQNYISDFKI